MASISYENESIAAKENIIWYPNQPTFDRNGGKYIFVWRGWCHKSAVHDLIPEDGTSMTDAPTNWVSDTGVTEEGVEGVASGEVVYKLKKARGSTTSSPDRMEVELTYEEDVEGEWERSCSIVDYEVDRERLYDLGGDWTYIALEMRKDKIATYNAGMLAYEASREVNIGDEDGDWRWTQAYMDRKIGLPSTFRTDFDTPSGLEDAQGDTFTPSKWKFRGSEVRDTGRGKARIIEKWNYSPLGFISPEETTTEE